MKEGANRKLVYQFGKFLLDPQEKTLFSDGVAVHLRAKEFETLLLLVENNGRALAKEEMISAVWQDAFVDEVNLAKQISRLRKIFNVGSEKLIETLPKHGYRFSADVNQIFQPFEETILARRTIKRLTVRFEEDFDEAPLALPAKRKRFWAAGILAAIILIAGLVAGVIWLYPRQKQLVKPVENRIVFLTEGAYEDAGAYWTNQNQIYFSRYISNARVESWMMNADGTNPRRANAEIKNLLYGRWSPDGNQVVFRKEGDNKTVYLAAANGANEIALPFVVGNMDWSPDGSEFVYQLKSSVDKSQIFLYTLASRKSVNLSGTDTSAADPSFSSDGKQIAFVSWRDGNAEIYVMQRDGSNVRRLTNHPAFDNFPVFAPDGTAIAFQSNRENERTEIYLQNLNDESPPRKISHLNGNAGISPRCWSADGTELLLWTDQNGKGQVVRETVEPFPEKQVLSDEIAGLSSLRLAPDGRQILYQARLEDHSLELRLTDLERLATVKIFKTEPNYPLGFSLAPAWSPDGRQIVFSNKSGGNSEIFMINTDGSGLQNLTNDPLPDTNPVFSRAGNEIIFVRHFYGKARLYRMNPDGSNQRRLTEKEGYEMAPAFSADGFYLAFAADRMKSDSRGLDIFLLEFKSPANEKRLTALHFHETAPTFSPDGKKIAFISASDGNSEIYLMNSDGTGLFRLTRSKREETAPQFFKNGKALIFSAGENEKSAIYEIELP